jgi:hypothetical protein
MSADLPEWWGARHAERMGNTTTSTLPRRLTIRGGFTVIDTQQRRLNQQARRLGFADLRSCLQALLGGGWSIPPARHPPRHHPSDHPPRDRGRSRPGSHPAASSWSASGSAPLTSALPRR